MVVSPLTDRDDVTLLKTIQVDLLIKDWQNSLNIDITEELCGCKEIYLYQCNQTKLNFFLPIGIAGSEKLYESLEKFDWYYMPRKWEHDVSVQDLQDCQKVLEVGCGRGSFVERLSKELKLNAQGIELNSSAVRYAKGKGISVEQLDLYSLLNEQEASFDAICSFQVLEHVENPKEFLSSLIKLIKPNGKLILSVPNADSFLRYSDKNLLDQPPHHITQWRKETFENLTSFFPIQVYQFRIEPLTEYHVNWYISIQISRLLKTRLLQSLSCRIANRTLAPLLKKAAVIRNSIAGHTLYVCFEKTN